MDDLYRSLYPLAKLLLAEDEPDRTVELLLDGIRERTGAERGFIVVREGDRFVQKLDVNYERSRLGEEERRFSRSIVKAAIDGRQVVETELASADPRFASAESVETTGQRSVRVAPFESAGGEVVGVIYLERQASPFHPNVTPMLRELGAIAGSAIQRALDRQALRLRNQQLEHDLFAQHDFREIVTRDARMLELLKMVAQVADSRAAVLILGETGTGKELIARALHVNSARRRKPLVTLHCSALPETLLESELFGHRRGAFSGAERERAGRLAQAAGGTLFLDEVADIPAPVQAKLLRFLQFGEIQRVGSDEVERLDVRVLAATNQDLARKSKDGSFRQDLYYRLNVVQLSIPPLRERRADILPLADTFIRRLWQRGGTPPRLTARAERTLEAHDYPGNVRELEHLVERACLLANGGTIDVDVLPEELARAAPAMVAPRFERFHVDELARARNELSAAMEREFVTGLLERHGGNVSQAARDSGMNRTHLQRLLAKYREIPQS